MANASNKIYAEQRTLSSSFKIGESVTKYAGSVQSQNNFKQCQTSCVSTLPKY